VLDGNPWTWSSTHNRIKTTKFKITLSLLRQSRGTIVYKRIQDSKSTELFRNIIYIFYNLCIILIISERKYNRKNDTSQNKLQNKQILENYCNEWTHLCLAWRWSLVLWWEGDKCHASWIWSFQELSRRFCCVVNASCCNEWSSSHKNKRTTSSSAWLLTRSWVHTEHINEKNYCKFSSSNAKLSEHCDIRRTEKKVQGCLTPAQLSAWIWSYAGFNSSVCNCPIISHKTSSANVMETLVKLVSYPFLTCSHIATVRWIMLYRFTDCMWSSGQSSWLHIQRSRFGSRRYQIFWEVVGLERGPLSLVITTKELLERKSSGSRKESREYRRRDVTQTTWHRGTSPTSGGRSVSIVCSRTQATEFSLYRFNTDITVKEPT
jgi:hypothetical protein